MKEVNRLPQPTPSREYRPTRVSPSEFMFSILVNYRLDKPLLASCRRMPAAEIALNVPYVCSHPEERGSHLD